MTVTELYLICLAILILAIAAYALWPRHYSIFSETGVEEEQKPNPREEKLFKWASIVMFLTAVAIHIWG